MPKKKKKLSENTIVVNRKVRHDFFVEDRFDAGIVLHGWEVKSLRQSKVQLTDSYVLFKNREAWLLGMHVVPLESASTHVDADPKRTKKLLLSKREIIRLEAAIAQGGYTCMASSLYWKRHLVKCVLVLAKGKKKHDKRASEKERDWERDKDRLVKQANF